MRSKSSELGRANLARSAAGVTMVSAALFGGLSLISAGLLASLNATAFNPAPQQVTTQTLKLTQAPSGTAGLSGGISSTISNLAPGDTVNRFVDLSNNLGDANGLAGQSLTLGVVDGALPATRLTTDGTIGLQVTVYECDVPWTTVTGLCNGGAGTVVMAETSALGLTTAPVAVTPDSLEADTTSHLRLEIKLPAGSEVTQNGVLPAATIQGKTAELTWTFTLLQRDPITTQG